MYPYFKIDDRLLSLGERAEELASPAFKRISNIQRYNQQKVLAAFELSGVSESHFAQSTGYGYGDRGRDVLDKVYACSFGAEDALARWNFVSGTHALTVALFGVLRPGEKILCVTGTPYDTIQGVFGIGGRKFPGSLGDFGIKYEQLDLLPDGSPDYAVIERAVSDKYRMVYIQRSRGYSLRPSLSCREIGKICETVKERAPHAVILVDNCYGEFVEREEPLSCGADLIAGSMIKNPGGGIAPTGGYIAGRRDLVEQCAFRLTSPGIGGEVGCTLDVKREMFLGAFHAPFVTGEALKTAVFAASLFDMLGFEVSPKPLEERHDIIQTVRLGTRRALIAFCKGLQKGSPVDSFVSPEPSPMPGYENDVIMAAGTFTLGSSIELSADGPLREPYAVYMQGGVNYPSAQVGVLMAAQEMLESGLLEI